jgi:hypothetical protein
MPQPEVLIEVFHGLRYDPQAKRSYELMSGGFVWSDEYPAGFSWGTGDFALRFLVGYRASLVRGAPREELRSVWDAVLAGCPDWPGFRPERRSTDLVGELDRASKRMMRSVDALDRASRKH